MPLDYICPKISKFCSTYVALPFLISGVPTRLQWYNAYFYLSIFEIKEWDIHIPLKYQTTSLISTDTQLHSIYAIPGSLTQRLPHRVQLKLEVGSFINYRKTLSDIGVVFKTFLWLNCYLSDSKFCYTIIKFCYKVDLHRYITYHTCIVENK